MSALVKPAQTIAHRQAPMLFRVGMFVTYKNEPYCIRSAEPDYMILQHQKNHKLQWVTPEEWSSAYRDGALTITLPDKVIALHPITDSDHLAKAERMLAYLNELDASGAPGSEMTRRRVIKSIALRINDPEPPHHMQLYRFYKRWVRAGKEIYALFATKQTRTKPVTDAQLDFALHIIDEHFLVPHGGNRSELYRCFKAQFELESNQVKFDLTGKPMSKTALDNIVDSLDPYEVIAAQKGTAAANAQFRNSNEKITTYFPGERVEIDAVHLNLGLVDETTGEYQGRVILFIAIDVHTRYITGYSIVYGDKPAESGEAVINLLKHMVSPKANNGNFANDWHDLGVPHCIHADNGAGFIAESTLRFCAMLNTDLHRSESRKSQRRPFIERFNRTLREQLMTKIPGYLGKRIDSNNFNKTIEQAAVVTLSEFTRYLEEFIADYYHQNPHKGLDGLSPSQKLEQCRNDFLPRPVADLSKINALTGATCERTIQETHGIQIQGLHYNSTELRNLRFRLMNNRENKKPGKVEVIFNAQDISSVTVLVPGEIDMLIVPLRDKTVALGTSLSEYKVLKSKGRAATAKAEAKVFPSKHKNHKKPKPKKLSEATETTRAKSTVATHEGYSSRDVLKEGTARLAQDDTQRTSMEPAVSQPPKTQKGSGRQRSGGR
ncbi:transposase [Agarivorans sp. DSG3-1]|uniref:transposase n=1 Tax=Agarivorans sp. DSG3-1 TaxID=3342249 RepID=UPI00398E4B1C